MIVDVTGVELMPGNGGEYCPGNGLHPAVECCCDECDYAMCCWMPWKSEGCLTCKEQDCPRVGKGTIWD